MTAEQYRVLLRELAQLGGLSDPSALLEQGRVRVGEWTVQLVHEPDYEAQLVQVRMFLGNIPQPYGTSVTRALLHANYVNGYGGECVFSLVPGAQQVAVTLRLRLVPSMTAQELWQELSDNVRHGARLWESATEHAAPSHFHPVQMQRV